MPEGKEKLCAECASVTDGLRVEQLKFHVFQPFPVGERTGEGVACKYRLV